jgi:aminoglycoside phosphotransferase (APT) family kinase protein
VFAGAPSDRFPWPWSVVPWISGTTAEGVRVGRRDTATVADTLAALHRPAPDDAPVNPFRGVALTTRNDLVEARLARLRSHPRIDAPRLAALWHDALAAPLAQERVWLHGDLHPRNVVVRGGRVVGLIDWGDLSGGDVATDLACAWTLIDSPVRRRELLDACGAPAAAVERARGWAVHLGLALADSGEPRHVPIGLDTLERVGSGR